MSSSSKRAVEVVISTLGTRPGMLAEAIESVRAQDYDGPLSLVVVLDGVNLENAVGLGIGAGSPADDWSIPVRTLENYHSPGLAGSRNSGVETSNADIVAFLDDDDWWLPTKLSRQLARMEEDDADFATTAMQVVFRGKKTVRLARTSEVTHEQLVESRMAMLHSSSFLARRAALIDVGLVDESAPQSQNEDWDLLLRVSRRRPITHLDEPLVSIRWGTTSLFARAWESKIAAGRWIAEKHPEIKQSRVGYARLLGQIGFAQAALGQRRIAFKTARASSRLRRCEPRAYLAMAVAGGISPALILKVLHKRGHGI
jgi:glycosyltransferase involved in cell wall biosynthesis